MSYTQPRRKSALSYCPEDIAAQYDSHGNKIRRPMNAFMVFANQNRMALRQQMVGGSNQMVSVRLGEIWHAMSAEDKDVYYREAKKGEREHAVRYPDYRYLPNAVKENRLEKHEDIHRRLLKQFEKQRKIKKFAEVAEERESAYSPYSGFLLKPPRFQLRRPGKIPPSIYDDYSAYMSGCPPGQVYRIPSPIDRYRYSDTQQTGVVFPPRSASSGYGDGHYTDNYMYSMEEDSFNDECQRAVANIPDQESTASMTPEPRACIPALQHNERTPDHGVTSSQLGYTSATDNTNTDNYDDDEASHPRGDTSPAMEETNYVMIPCDINIAKMLGWPVHLLKRVSQAFLETLQTAATRPMTLQSVLPGWQSDSTMGGLPTPDPAMEPTSTSMNSPIEAQPPATDVGSQPTEDTGSTDNGDVDRTALDLSVKRRRLMDDKMIRKARKHFKGDNQQVIDEDLAMHKVVQNAAAIPSTVTDLQQPAGPTSSTKAGMFISKYPKSGPAVPATQMLQRPHNSQPRNDQPTTAARVASDARSSIGGTAQQQSKKSAKNNFQVFQIPDGETDSLENIDTSTMSALFGQMDSADIAAYRSSGSQEDKDWHL